MRKAFARLEGAAMRADGKTFVQGPRSVPVHLSLASLLFLSLHALPAVGVVAQAGSSSAAPALTLEERVEGVWAIEEIYWQHRIWPAGQGEKPPLETLLSRQEVRDKVEETLRKSAALENIWGIRITPARLQAEMDRMGRETRRPEMLREMFAALDNDPYRIAESLVRPLVVDQLIRSAYAGSRPKAPRGGEREEPEIAFGSWWSEARERVSTVASSATTSTAASYRLPAIASPVRRLAVSGEEPAGSWGATPGSVADARAHHTAIWTGQEMIVWGGLNQDGFLGSGGRYDTLTDMWQELSPIDDESSLTPRAYHTAVWTGSRMIVWGGSDGMPSSTGASYDPATDTWTAISVSGAPAPRWKHTAIWTGQEMIVWGGQGAPILTGAQTQSPSGSQGDSFPNGGSALGTGGAYDPETDTWRSISAIDAPSPRFSHAAVWTGSRMIVWGGTDGTSEVNTGGRYDPKSDTWAPVSTDNSPQERKEHTAVWTGTEMIVWGGSHAGGPLGDGGRHDPEADSWISTPSANAPTSRSGHVAAWTGQLMAIWGGIDGSGSDLATGGYLDPALGTWTATDTEDAPPPREGHTAIWTGDGGDLLVWGGRNAAAFLDDGGKNKPAPNTWRPTSQEKAPSKRAQHSAVWTGTEMIVWGGYDSGGSLKTGGRYNPATNKWTATSVGDNVPGKRQSHTAVWTGTVMVVWGGSEGNHQTFLKTGGRYNPANDTWAATSVGANVPSPRSHHTAIWTGSRMIVWGGIEGNNYLNTGGRYDPSNDSWTATSTGANVPSGRWLHTAVWSGTHMIVWGGSAQAERFNTGGRYNPTEDTWQATTTTNAPRKRNQHTGVWTGTLMIVWGGSDTDKLKTGGRYNPGENTWTATSETGAPAARFDHTAVWTGQRMVVWGGVSGAGPPPLPTYTGGRYDPGNDTWGATEEDRAPEKRRYHTAVWTGSEMIIWGGLTSRINLSGEEVRELLASGGRFTP